MSAAVLTLALDASTYTGSVAILDGSRVLAARSVAMRGAHEERLMPAVAEALEAAGATVGALGRVVCGEGPGSFTSLRIAASIAKGIAAARAIPLWAVASPLLALAAAEVGAGRYLVLTDALRGELFGSAYAVEDGTRRGESLHARELGPPSLIAAADAERVAAGMEAVAIGAGSAVDAVPVASAVSRLVGVPGALRVVSLAEWEPTYGRLAEAQVKWEAAHGRPLDAGK